MIPGTNPTGAYYCRCITYLPEAYATIPLATYGQCVLGLGFCRNDQTKQLT